MCCSSVYWCSRTVAVYSFWESATHTTHSSPYALPPSSNETQLTDDVKIRYSSEAIKAASGPLDVENHALVTGWQEISSK